MLRENKIINPGVGLLEYGTVFALGGFGYGLLEILWRGYTHWSMIVTGACCLGSIYRWHKSHQAAAWMPFCLFCGAVITAFELLAGILVNVIGKMNVWDYSGFRIHLFGQICLPYSILWCFLGLPIKLICTKLEAVFCA